MEIQGRDGKILEEAWVEMRGALGHTVLEHHSGGMGGDAGRSGPYRPLNSIILSHGICAFCKVSGVFRGVPRVFQGVPPC